MNFNFDNDRPIYSQLTNFLKEYIISGKLKPNEKLPSVRELALKIKINPNTVQKALEKLEQEKLIYTERTNGKYVTDNEKLIEKTKRKLAEEKVNNYLKSMEDIGIEKKDAIKYLQDIGGQNGIS